MRREFARAILAFTFHPLSRPRDATGFVCPMNFLFKTPQRIHFIVLLGYTLIAVVMTYPLAFRLNDSLIGSDTTALNDTYYAVWTFGWQARQLIVDPLNFFQGNIFYPFPNTLAFSEIVLPGALLYLPIEYATGNPVLAYNLVILLSFPLNAFAMYVCARNWLQTADHRPQTPDKAPFAIRDARYAAFIAGIIFAFCTYKMGELRHNQLLFALFIPLTLLYVAKFFRAPNSHNALLSALFFALNALSCLYYAVFLSLAVALFVGVEIVLRRLRISRQHLGYGALALGMAVLLLMPFAPTYLSLERENNFSVGRNPNLFSARPASYLATPRTQWLYGALTSEMYVLSKGQPLFPGMVTLVLAAIGLVALIRAKNRAWIFLLLLALMGFVLSFGPNLMLDRSLQTPLPFPLPYAAFARVITPLKSLNAPARFVVLTMFSLSLFAAFGLEAILKRLPRWGGVFTFGCVLLILLEYISAPTRYVEVNTPTTISPVYAFLAQQPRNQVVVELPMGEPDFAGQNRHVEYVYNSLYHRLPLINGYSTFIPPDYYALVQDVQVFPKASALKRLNEWGADWIVVHSDQFKNANELREQLAKRKILEHVQDFGEIWLYRMSR